MSQWGSHMSYVPPPPPESTTYEPIPPLQPHLTGLTDFGHGADGPTNYSHPAARSTSSTHRHKSTSTTTTNWRRPPSCGTASPNSHINYPGQTSQTDKFDGKKDKSTTFKVAITQYLRSTYPGSSDDDKIAFIISYLDGKAAEWVEPHMEHDVLRQAVPWLHNVNLFWAEFEKRFGEIDRATKALKKLKSLKQKSSVQDYVTEFQSLAAYVNYDDLALCNMFYEGLKDEIKMAMLSQLFDVKDSATTGQMVVDRALLIDQHLEQFSVKGKIESIGRNNRGQVVPNVKWAGQNSTVQVPFPALKKDDRPSTGTARAPPPPPALAKGKGPGPMELDGERRSGGITCLRCQGKGHMACDCPSKPISGFEARIEEVKEPDSDDESVKDDA
ncbi:Retrotransposon gag protein [Ceratobasidium sp. AG-Ba]|nr:Retrotransposon gag protein [Ceratobasidium sp. AG-Ba]